MIPVLGLTGLAVAVALAAMIALAGRPAAAQSQPGKPASPAPAPAPAPTPATPAAQTEPKPCSTPEFRQLDFWIGDWDLTHQQRVARDKDEWQAGKATNSIRAILDGCVIEEHFEDAGQGFRGQSVSLYNPMLHKWQQTWVDNSGEYLDFTGGLENGRMILSRPARIQGKEGFQRMVFRDIKPDSFDWDWESSIDGGKTWVTMWKIHYTRRK